MPPQRKPRPKPERDVDREQWRAAGVWLKDAREKAGLTQLALSKALGFDYPVIIGQIETGRSRLPRKHYAQMAVALKVEPKHFVREVMRFYDPEIYRILFED